MKEKGMDIHMTKTVPLKKQLGLKYAAVLLFVLLAVWILGLLGAVTRTKTEDLFLTPLITDANGWELYTMEHGSRRICRTCTAPVRYLAFCTFSGNP